MANIADLYVTGIKPVVSTALESSHRLSATGPGVLYYLNAQNYTATGRLLLLIDSALSVVPTNTNGLIWVGVMPAFSTVPVSPLYSAINVPPLQFVNGLWAVLTTSLTTPFTLTPATADMFISALVQTS